MFIIKNASYALACATFFTLSLHANQQIMHAIQSEYQLSLQNPLLQKMGNVTVNQIHNATVYSLVKEVSQAMGINIPAHIFVFKGNYLSNKIAQFNGVDFRLNAFARGNFKNSSIIIGEELLTLLTYQELRAIIAHELGHVKHNHYLKTVVPHFVATYALFGGLYLGHRACDKYNVSTTKQIWLLYSAAVAGTMYINSQISKVSRENEKIADREAFLVIKDKNDLISALKKMDAAIKACTQKSWIVRTFNSHPSLEERDALLTAMIAAQ